MDAVVGDFVVTMDELRVVTRFVAESAEPLLPHIEDSCPDDSRPRAALDAAWRFVEGERRTNLQRVSSTDAHRAAATAPTEVARLSAQAAGDAASAAYLHPIAQGRQVGHILRAAANAACVHELLDDGRPGAAARSIQDAVERATPALVSVLRRYPVAPVGRSRASHLMSDLDSRLRATS